MITSILLGLFVNSPVYSQYLRNPSLESQAVSDNLDLVDGWGASDNWSNPNFYQTYTPYRNPSSILYTPVDSNYFALFRARGDRYDSVQGWGFPPHTREYIYEKLLRPLEPNSCFEFKVSLCYNPDYQVYDLDFPDTAFPVKFQVWGAFGPDARNVPLLDTRAIRNTTWKEYTSYFTTEDQEISYILIEVAWDTINVYSKPYSGFALVDNLKLSYVGKPTVVPHNRLFHGDNKDILTPDNEGISYHWYPAEAVSDSTARSPRLREFTDSVKVAIKQENECPVIETFYFTINCDTLYPNKELDTVDFYYKFKDGLHLQAGDGISWQWNPPTDLSAANVQSPVLTDYNEYYQVHIQDKYHCERVENFHIIWNCDTLYPNGELVALNDTLTEPEDITLKPFVGSPVSNWSPPDYLSCTDCESTVASPRSSITYSIDMKDNYQCFHTEKFVFTVPLKIPNVITPNGDGYNDCYKVFGLPENTTFYLFDKSGRILCTVPNFEAVECWDGSREHLRSGTYWYAFESPGYGTLAKGFLLIVR